MLITISRQFAAGGSKVAGEVAERLGWRLVDNDFVQEIADRAGVTPEEVAEREERPSTFIERLARITALEIPEMFLPTSDVLEEHGEAHFVRLTRLLVEELAAEQRCVVVGRASAAVLSRVKDTLHVRIVAPRAFRIERAMSQLGLDRDEAEGRLESTDANRTRYHREYHRRDCTDPANYDMVLNTGRLGISAAANVIMHRARILGWA
jgi:cytidylate kinase